MTRPTIYTTRYAKVWLRQHGAQEKRLKKALASYFDKLASDVADQVRGGVTTPALICDVAGWNETLKATVKPFLLRSAGAGAELEWKLGKPKKSTKDEITVDLGSILELGKFDLPEAVMARIDSEIKTSMRQPFWDEIGKRTQRLVEDTVAVGVENGDSYKTLAASIQDVIGGSTSRALSIARTETTSALNAGHHEARAELITDGLIVGSEWVSMIDAFTRETHAELDGETVDGDANFDVGGYEAPYPGHWSLPAEERVRCRCTTVASGTFAAD